MQGAVPARQCGTERKTGHQVRQGGNGDENGDGGADGDESENRNGHEDRDGGGNGSRNGDKNRERGGEGESLEAFEVVIEVGQKTREGGRRQRVTSSQS